MENSVKCTKIGRNWAKMGKLPKIHLFKGKSKNWTEISMLDINHRNLHEWTKMDQNDGNGAKLPKNTHPQIERKVALKLKSIYK